MEAEGYGTPDEDAHADVKPSSMTINEIKDWLTEHGHENVVWGLTQAKAKKPKSVSAPWFTAVGSTFMLEHKGTCNLC